MKVDHNAFGWELNFERLNLESKGKNTGSFALEFYFGTQNGPPGPLIPSSRLAGESEPHAPVCPVPRDAPDGQ